MPYPSPPFAEDIVETDLDRRAAQLGDQGGMILVQREGDEAVRA